MLVVVVVTDPAECIAEAMRMMLIERFSDDGKASSSHLRSL